MEKSPFGVNSSLSNLKKYHFEENLIANIGSARNILENSIKSLICSCLKY